MIDTIERLWPEDGHVLLTGPAKSGKTTLAVNAATALASGALFLDRCSVRASSVTYLTTQTSAGMIRRWIADTGLPEHDPRLAVVDLRGSVTVDSVAAHLRAGIAAHLGAGIVILDGLAPLLAALNADENSGTDVARFYDWWVGAIRRSGGEGSLIVHPSGHDGEHPRGSSELLSAPDAIWTLRRDTTADHAEEMFAVAPTRFLQAYGRDVDAPPEPLAYDPSTRLLALTGPKRGAKRRPSDQVKALLADGKARSKTAIAVALTGMQTNLKAAAVQTLIDTGHLYDTGMRVNSSKGDPTSGSPLYLWTDTP